MSVAAALTHSANSTDVRNNGMFGHVESHAISASERYSCNSALGAGACPRAATTTGGMTNSQ